MKVFNSLTILFTTLIISCTNSSTSIESIEKLNEPLVVIKVEEPYQNKFPFDSIFNDIQAIPLETNNQCLIGNISKVMVKGNCIFIKEFSGNLYVFTNKGKFLSRIGKRGKGPGEYLDSRDFDVDKEGNIYILDYMKIKKYDSNGLFIQDINFKSEPQDPFYTNPLQFALCGTSDFYLWGGSFDLSMVDKEKKHFGLYKIDKNGKKIASFFPINTLRESEPSVRFSYFQNTYNVLPRFANDTIYSLNNKGIYPKFFVDFGSRRVTKTPPHEEGKLQQFKMEVANNNSYGLEPFVESNNWIFFRFIYKNYCYKVYYSKIKKKSYVSKMIPEVKNMIIPFEIKASIENDMVGILETGTYFEILATLKKSDPEHTLIKQKNFIDQLKNLKEMDNPVLLICKMK